MKNENSSKKLVESKVETSVYDLALVTNERSAMLKGTKECDGSMVEMNV